MKLTDDQINELVEQQSERSSKLRKNLQPEQNLLLDLFMDNNRIRQIPRYAENILWFIENIDEAKNFPNQKFIKNIKEISLIKIQEKKEFSLRELKDFPISFQKILLKDEYLVKRIDFLLKDNHINNWLFFKNKFIRNCNMFHYHTLKKHGFNPFSMKNFAIDCIEMSGGTLLNDLILNDQNDFKQYTDLEKNNILFCAIERKSWKLIKTLQEIEPKIFLETDMHGDTFFSKLSKVNYHQALFDTQIIKEKNLNIIPKYIKNVILHVFSIYEKENKPFNLNGLSSDIHILYKQSLYTEMNKNLETNTEKLIKKSKI